MEKIKELFDEYFKFKINDTVRHKADGKNNDWGTTTEMGLLILARTIEEEIDDSNNAVYSKHYHCRMIKFAGSGSIASFKEQELMSTEEFMRKQIEDKEWSNNVREEMKQTEQEIFKSFNVKRGTQIYLIKDGITDKENPYRISGYFSNAEKTVLSARAVLGEGKENKSIELKSKGEFEVVVE